MKIRELTVEGALEIVPPTFTDNRGVTVVPFQQSAFVEHTGRAPFPVRQLLHSVSARGVVRGVHFTRTPPGSAKYVSCVHGAVLDFVIDLRMGSPTFGRYDMVVLDELGHRSVYVPVGVGHAFAALRDDTRMSYLLSTEYVAEDELAVSALDSGLSLPIPDSLRPIVSERDAAAPTLAEAAGAGLLPDYLRCREVEWDLTDAEFP